MKILVNDVPIDYQLESETSAGQVYLELDQWLRSNGHRIESVRVNGNDVEPETTSWRNTAVEEVTELAVQAVSVREAQVERFETLIQYFALLQRVLREGSEQQLRDVLDEHPYIESSLPDLLPEACGLIAGAFGVGVVEGSVADDASLETRKKLADQLEWVLAILNDRWKELLDPRGQLYATTAALHDLLPKLEELPGYLHTGKEKDALSIVTRFSELASKLLRLIPMWIDTIPNPDQLRIEDQSLKDFAGALNDNLQELVDGLNAQDLVLVADLLEYEIVPRFRGLIAELNNHTPVE